MPPRTATLGVALLVVVVLSNAVSALDNATAHAAPSFLECLSAVRGRASRAALFNSDDAQREAILGGVVGCAKAPVIRGLRAVRESRSESGLAGRGGGGDVSLWDGAVVLHRLHEDAVDAREANRDAARAMADDGDDGDLVGVHDVIVELDRVSRAYAMDVEVYPGVTASLHRDARSEDAVNLSFRLDTKALDRDDDDEEEEEGPSSSQGRDVAEDLEELDAGVDALEDRHGHKKKKVLKGLKKLKKKLAPYLPLLAIPLALQLLLLPLYMMALKVMALKSILLGKMTLMLVAFNILRNAHQRQL